MATTTFGSVSISTDRSKAQKYRLDTTRTLEINGTKQRVRICGVQSGLPPVLIVQAGPGFPLLNEVSKFQQRLKLEQDFTVAYWDQRGCGNARSQDIQKISLETQVQDLCEIVRWFADETQQKIVILGISIGATNALQAATRESSKIKAVVAVSVDTDMPVSDTAAMSFLQKAGIQKIPSPPYLDVKQFQLRGRMLTDLGGIESGKRFGQLLRGLLRSLITTYGLLGTVATLRNMNAVQRKLLPEFAQLNLFANWPRLEIPVHYIFGESDPLNPSSIVQKVSARLKKGDTIATLPNAGHMAHFDQPAFVRSMIVQAHYTS
jgi:pimeloyl-ACP methyl ester carboxylesterase